MDDFWRWVDAQAGNIISIAGLITGFIFYWLSLRPKRFGWQIMSQTGILSASSGHLPLKVVFDGKDVVSPNITVVRLGNSGKVELKAGDFDGPVKISFDNNHILQIRLSGRSSEAINPSMTQENPRTISFTPKLLNPREWIEYQLITDGPLEVPTVSARVAGQGSSSIHDQSKRTTRLQIIGVAVILGGPVLGLIFSVLVGGDAASWFQGIGWAIALLGVVIINRAEASAWKKLPRTKRPKRARK